MSFLRVLTLLVVSGLMIGSDVGAANSAALASKIHGKTHHITETVFLIGKNSCSGTAIGPYALLTATHCEMPTDTITVDGQVATIKAFARDGHDHTMFLLGGIKPFADIASVDMTPVEVGQDIFMFGNPGKEVDYFRKGYVSKIEPDDDDETLDTIILDINTFFGDSGSGLFNEDGKLVGVLSCGDLQKLNDTTFQTTCAFNLRFTKEQIDYARNFKP